MTRKTKLAGLAVACVLAMSITTSAFAHGSGNSNSSQGQMPMMGQGMMGSQMPMMGGYGMMGQMPMMGPGMMGGQMPMMGGYGMMGQMPMMGSGMMGSQMPMMGGWGGMQVLRRDLTADEVKHMMEHRLAWSGNQNVKLGNVSEKEGDVIEVEITDKDGKVVQKLKVGTPAGCRSFNR